MVIEIKLYKHPITVGTNPTQDGQIDVYIEGFAGVENDENSHEKRRHNHERP